VLCCRAGGNVRIQIYCENSLSLQNAVSLCEGNELQHIHYRCKSTKNKYNFSSFDEKFSLDGGLSSRILSGLPDVCCLEHDTRQGMSGSSW
jgi:hypothetical protein